MSSIGSDIGITKLQSKQPASKRRNGKAQYLSLKAEIDWAEMYLFHGKWWENGGSVLGDLRETANETSCFIASELMFDLSSLSRRFHEHEFLEPAFSLKYDLRYICQGTQREAYDVIANSFLIVCISYGLPLSDRYRISRLASWALILFMCSNSLALLSLSQGRMPFKATSKASCSCMTMKQWAQTTVRSSHLRCGSSTV